MGRDRRVRLFRNGVNQAVRIPVKFEMDGEDAIMRKEGDKLILEPVKSDRLAGLLENWEPIDEPFPRIDEIEIPLDEPNLGS